MPLLRKGERRMLQRTIDTCHIVGPTTVSNKINGFMSSGCFRDVYVFFFLPSLVKVVNISTLRGQLVWGVLGCCSWDAPFGSCTAIYMLQNNREKERGETYFCNCSLGFLLLHNLDLFVFLWFFLFYFLIS